MYLFSIRNIQNEQDFGPIIYSRFLSGRNACCAERVRTRDSLGSLMVHDTIALLHLFRYKSLIRVDRQIGNFDLVCSCILYALSTMDWAINFGRKTKSEADCIIFHHRAVFRSFKMQKKANIAIVHSHHHITDYLYVVVSNIGYFARYYISVGPRRVLAIAARLHRLFNSIYTSRHQCF